MAGAIALSVGPLPANPLILQRGELLANPWSAQTAARRRQARRGPNQLVATVGRDLELLKD